VADPNDQDFGNQTIIVKPNPGGRRAQPQQQAPAPTSPSPSPAPIAANVGDFRSQKHSGTVINPLEDGATVLLTLVSNIRNTSSHPNPPGLRDQMVEEMKSFEQKSRKAGVQQETVHAARYVLCAVIDEMVLNTPWGNGSAWGSRTLLSMFYNETWGGENFFLMLDNLVKDPGNNIDMLELMYICLSLGFEGRYAAQTNGYSELEELRSRLYRIIRTQRGDREKALSPNWQGIIDNRNPLIRYVPLWVVGCVLGLILLVLYWFLSSHLNQLSNPQLSEIAALGRNIDVDIERPEPPAAPSFIRSFLAPEVAEGLVYVTEKSDRTIVTIRGEGLFRSGSDELNAVFLPLMARISDGLKDTVGRVLVTGHTDNQPISTLRFPSNWHLSDSRAETVRKMLADQVGQPARFSAEGFADTEPLTSNDTPEGRAQNRRVEITLMEIVR